MWGCFRLIVQTWKGNIHFTEFAERVEYGNYGEGGEWQRGGTAKGGVQVVETLLGQHSTGAYVLYYKLLLLYYNIIYCNIIYYNIT